MITRYSINGESESRKSLNILLAEDNAVNQKLAIGLLEKRGHRVTVACNGLQALSALENGSFDLVLMDVQMPVMDGLEATTLLREREKASGEHQAVVAMTALVMKGDRERCMATGMDGYLSKPISPQELDEVLDSYQPVGQVSASGRVNTEQEEGPICVKDLLDRIDGDRTLLAELLELLREDAPEQIRAAHHAIETGDAPELQKIGHALRGALANLAAPTAAQFAGELEATGMAGVLDSSEATLAKLENELARVITSLEGLCLEAV